MTSISETNSKNKKWYKKWWVIALLVIFGFAFISSLGDSGTGTSVTPSESIEESEPQASLTERADGVTDDDPEDANQVTEEGIENARAETTGEKNARRSAESYLDYSSFSRQGLIDQLLYEEFSRADAEYAVDAVDADWTEQAAKSAKEYINYSSFSRQGLINQLLYEEFSQADAVHGADASGADWMEQAAKSAKQYLDYSSFSRQGLIDQLIYEGFSNAQAEYGVSQNGY